MLKLTAIASSLVVSLSLLTSAVAEAKAYKGAEIYSNSKYKYGRYEMRMMAAKGSGVLSTFFTYKPGSEVAGTFWEEIDIEIFGKNNATQWQSNVIIGTNRPTSKTEGLHTTAFSMGDNYHTYVLEWTPDYIAWYVDGAQTRRITGGQFVTGLTNPQDVRFNTWAANIAEWVGPWSDSILPVYQFVNYIDYKPYNTSTKTFATTGGWRDDFNSFDTARWSKGNYTFGENLADFDPNNAVVKNGTLILALTKEGQTGFNGLPPSDSGSAPSLVIQAETFNQVGGSVTINNGVVGYIDAGEWMKYTNVNIPQTGTYKVEYAVASAITTAQFTLDRDGVGLGTISVPNTGGWGAYQIISHNIYFNAGTQNLAIYANSGGFNVDWIKLTKI